MNVAYFERVPARGWLARITPSVRDDCGTFGGTTRSDASLSSIICCCCCRRSSDCSLGLIEERLSEWVSSYGDTTAYHT